MKLKVLLGLGIACAACCALPLMGFAGFTFGAGSLAAGLGVSLDFIVCVLGPLALVAGMILVLWNRRRPKSCAACPIDKSCGCT